jgi:GTPase
MPDAPHKSGFVSIIGRPNAGKSTLLNALVGARLAIVSDKPQTTRTNIQGVLTTPDAQVVFLDTPGVHRSGSLLDRRMLDDIRTALDQRDLLILITDASKPFRKEDEQAVDLVKKREAPVILALNKIDRLPEKARLLPLIERYRSLNDFADYVPLSAATGEGVDTLRQAILDRLPEGPPQFPEDYVTDQPERFMAAEIIREKVLAATREEVPHSTAVTVDRWEEKPNLTHISSTVYVERTGQKAIIIGSAGAMLKKIGTDARHDIEQLIGRKVFLELFVKVQPNWQQNPGFLNELDWRTMADEESD